LSYVQDGAPLMDREGKVVQTKTYKFMCIHTHVLQLLFLKKVLLKNLMYVTTPRNIKAITTALQYKNL
jgi:hypothetical protein